MSARSVKTSKAGSDYINKYLKTQIANGNLHILNDAGDSLYHILGGQILDDVNLFLPPLSGDDTIATQNTNNSFGGVQTFNQGIVSQGGLLLLPDPLGILNDDITISDGLNITLGINQGTTIATSPSQMLGFYGAIPVNQQVAGGSPFAGTTSTNIFDVWDSLVTLGLISGNLSSGFEDITESAQPINPPAGTRRLYVDSTSHALTSLDSGGVLHNLEFTLNTQNNAFGAFYEDITEIAAPANPASGTRRIYVNSTSHALTARDSAGTDHNLETSITVGHGLFVANGGSSTYSIPHGMSSTPTMAVLTAGNGASNGDVSVTSIDSTNINITFNSSVSSGTNNCKLNWVAFV